MDHDSACPDGDATHRASTLQRNQRVGRYLITEKLASGGMGDVYLADDVLLNRLAVLKFISEPLRSDKNGRARFLREAQAAARLNHPTIVTIYEVSDYRGWPYMAMEWVSNKTLADSLKSGSFPVHKAVEIAGQLADALVEAHRVGVIHRDIKPTNILLTPRGGIKLADFGLASIQELSSVTEPGQVMGTAGYMAPEQLLGQPCDARSDLFSVGIVLYEMLTGRRPFRGDYHAAMAYSVVHETPTPLSESNPNVTPELAELVQRLLEKRPERRFASAGEFRKALTKLATSGGATETELRQSRIRRRFMRAGTGAAIVALGFLLPFLGSNSVSPDGEGSEISLAVIPFENLGSSENEYFVDGVTAEITSRLARLPGLRVIAPTSAMQYKATNKRYHEIGQELDVAYILGGTLQGVVDSSKKQQLRMHLHLIRAENDSYLWREQYAGNLTDLFDLQADIATGVSAALDLAVSQAERHQLTRKPTSNLPAYDFYLLGNTYFNRSWSREDILIAVRMYEEAIALDPDFALAHAMLARGYASLYWEYYDRTAERCSLAVAMADRALALNPALAESHLARGYCYYHCELAYDSAMESFQRGLESNSNDADLYNAIGAVQRRQGLLIKSAGNFIAAYTLDPRSCLRSFDVALTFGMLRDYQQAFAFLDTTIALNPRWSLPYVYKAWLHLFRDGSVDRARMALAEAAKLTDVYSLPYFWWLSRSVVVDYSDLLAHTRPGSDTAGYLLHRAQIFRLMRRFDAERQCADSARTILEPQVQERPFDARFHSQLSLAYAGLRNRELALRHGSKAVTLLPSSREAFDAPILLLNLVEVLVVFEQYDEAIDQLEYLLTLPGFVSPQYLRVDPLWRPLDSLPRFRQLVDKPI